MDDPALTALLDQADAAMREGLAMFGELGTLADAVLSHTDPGPAERIALDRITGDLAAGTITWCPHVTPPRPEPVWWFADRPGRLRCWPCTRTVARVVARTGAASACSACQRRSRTIRPWLRVIAPGRVDGTVVGPVLALLAFCWDCDPHTDPG